MSGIRQKAVSEGRVNYLSATSICKFSPEEAGGCPRKWWFRYVKGIPEVEQNFHEDGQEIHRQIEHYLKTGEDHLSREVRAAKPFFPAPGTVEVEIGLEGFNINETPFIGRIDALNKSGTYIDSLGVQQNDPPGTVEVIDWKSSSNFSWAKGAEDLINTVQMAAYAVYSVEKFDAKQVRLSHVYINKKRPQAIKVTALHTLDEIVKRAQDLAQVVGLIKDVLTLETPEEVPPNFAACTAYRGCSYSSICPKTPDEILKARFGKGALTMGTLLDRVTALKAAQNQAQEPQPKPQPKPQEPVKAKEIEAEIAKLEAQELGVCAPCGETITSANGSRLLNGSVRHIGCEALGVNPPDAAPIPPSKSAQPISQEDAKAHPAIAVAAAGMGLVAEAAPASEEKPKRGRKPKAEGTPEGASESPKKALWRPLLLVGCLPYPSPDFTPVDLSPVVAKLAGNLAKMADCDDIRASDNPALTFGKWRGALASTVADWFAGLESGGVYVIGSRGDFDSVAVEALKPFCNVILGNLG